MTWRPGDPLILPVRFRVPDPPPGRAALFVDRLSGALTLALRSRRLPVPTERSPSRPDGAAPSPWAGTAAGTLHLSALMGGVVYHTVVVTGARPGMLVQVCCTGEIPRALSGAPFGSVVRDDHVRVGVPLEPVAGAQPVPVSLLVTVSSV